MTSSSGLLCRLDDLKQELGVPSTNHDNDLSMEIAIEVAGLEISDYCGRFFYPQTATRYYSAQTPYSLLTDDILSISALRTDADLDGVYETTWSTAAYVLWPWNAPLEPSPAPYTEIKLTPLSTGVFPCYDFSRINHRDFRGIQVVGTFGYATAVPPVIKKATLFQAARSYRAKDAPFGTVGGRDFGQEFRGAGAAGDYAGAQSLHPFTRKMIDSFRRRIVA